MKIHPAANLIPAMRGDESKTKKFRASCYTRFDPGQTLSDGDLVSYAKEQVKRQLMSAFYDEIQEGDRVALSLRYRFRRDLVRGECECIGFLDVEPISEG